MSIEKEVRRDILIIFALAVACAFLADTLIFSQPLEVQLVKGEKPPYNPGSIVDWNVEDSTIKIYYTVEKNKTIENIQCKIPNGEITLGEYNTKILSASDTSLSYVLWMSIMFRIIIGELITVFAMFAIYAFVWILRFP
jgi:hypothetical protein